MLIIFRYGRIVDRILGADSTQRKDAKQLLRLIVCSKRSLKWYEIQSAVSLDLKQANYDFKGLSFAGEAKDVCGSLVEIGPTGSVELVHSTAKRCVNIANVTHQAFADSNCFKLFTEEKSYQPTERRGQNVPSVLGVFTYALL
jgi:hypothetical protein